LKHKRAWIAAAAALILLVLVFIWVNSTVSRPVSKAGSQGVLRLLKPILDPIFGEDRITDQILRKTAHFLEFFLLGLGLRGLFLLLGQRGFQGTANSLFCALLAAVADESIQLLSARGAQVQDILLDFAGAFAGTLLLWGAYLLLRPGRQRR
jgi:VanZ family protein